jgi:hypothetical protein
LKKTLLFFLIIIAFENQGQAQYESDRDHPCIVPIFGISQWSYTGYEFGGSIGGTVTRVEALKGDLDNGYRVTLLRENIFAMTCSYYQKPEKIIAPQFSYLRIFPMHFGNFWLLTPVIGLSGLALSDLCHWTPSFKPEVGIKLHLKERRWNKHYPFKGNPSLALMYGYTIPFEKNNFTNVLSGHCITLRYFFESAKRISNLDTQYFP